MKKIFKILAIILITVACVYMGIKTRENNAIKITQIKTNSENAISYLLETKENNIIMIDGGKADDSEHLENLLLQKGRKS